MPVRLGVPQNISGLTDIVSNPIYATGVGLLKYSIANGDPEGGKYAGNEGGSMIDKLKNWFKGNF